MSVSNRLFDILDSLTQAQNLDWCKLYISGHSRLVDEHWCNNMILANKSHKF